MIIQMMGLCRLGLHNICTVRVFNGNWILQFDYIYIYIYYCCVIRNPKTVKKHSYCMIYCFFSSIALTNIFFKKKNSY